MSRPRPDFLITLFKQPVTSNGNRLFFYTTVRLTDCTIYKRTHFLKMDNWKMKYTLFIPLLLFFTSCKTSFTATHHLLNKGFPNNNVSNLVRRLHRAVLKHHPSLVIIMIGTNDMVNPPKMISFSEYRNKLNNVVHKIKQQGSDVLLLSPPPVDTVDLFKRRSRKIFKIPPNEKIDSINTIIQQTALALHCMYLDIDSIFQAHSDPNLRMSGLIRNEITAGKLDGEHPTAEGYRLIAESISNFLKNKDKDYKRIICYGDSITFGAYVHGGGSTRGYTYPAVLNRLLFSEEIQT